MAKVIMNPKRWAILGGIILILFACLAACGVFAVKNLKKSRRYVETMAVYASGNFEKAMPMLFRVLSEDPNKEDAIVAMSETYHHFGDWGNESFFWHRAVMLNPFKQEYRDRFLGSTFQARNFNSLYAYLHQDVMASRNLTPDESALFVISALHSNHIREGKDFVKKIKTRFPHYFEETELGRYAEFLMGAEDMTDDQAETYFASLQGISNPQIKFEVINTQLYFLSKKKNTSQMEKLLKESADLNTYAGAPLLANFYFTAYRFDDTIAVCESYLKSITNAVMPVLFGESCVLAGKPEKIKPMAERFHSLQGRQSVAIASYLDALYAFASADMEKMSNSLHRAGANFATPLTALMNLQDAIFNRKTSDVKTSLSVVMEMRPFYDFQARARTAALQYILQVLDEKDSGKEMGDLAAIAELIQTPDDDSSFLLRIILGERYRRKILKENDLLDAVRKFPNDPFLLQMAAEYYLFDSKPDRTLEYITRFNDLEEKPEKSGIKLLYMLALDQQGKKDEAASEFQALVNEKFEDDGMMFRYFEYCAENNRLDALASLAEKIKSGKDAKLSEFIPFIQAELLLADGKKDEAMNLLEKSTAKNVDLTFHAAYLLASGDRLDAAVAKYQSILDQYPEKPLIQINLSEIYKEKGDANQAYELAQKAWKAMPDSLLARFVYSKRLLEHKQFASVISVLRLPRYEAPVPKDILALWADAVRAQIEIDFSEKRYAQALDNCKHLLLYFPGDAPILRRVEQINRLQSTRREKAEPAARPSAPTAPNL